MAVNQAYIFFIYVLSGILIGIFYLILALTK